MKLCGIDLDLFCQPGDPIDECLWRKSMPGVVTLHLFGSLPGRSVNAFSSEAKNICHPNLSAQNDMFCRSVWDYAEMRMQRDPLEVEIRFGSDSRHQLGLLP